MEHSDKLIEAIKGQNIQPIHKWRFTLRNTVIWASFVFSVIFGAVSFSVILLAIQQTDFNLLSHISHSKLEMFLALLPFIWIVLLMLFLVVAIFSIKNSWKGYKFSISRLVGINMAMSILLGTVCFIGGGAQSLEKSFSLAIDSYDSIQERKVKMWSQPKEGYLSGTIGSVDNLIIRLIDFENKSWEIAYEDAFIAPMLFLEEGEKIKLTGKMNNANNFKAEEIRPWGGGRGKTDGMRK